MATRLRVGETGICATLRDRFSVCTAAGLRFTAAPDTTDSGASGNQARCEGQDLVRDEYSDEGGKIAWNHSIISAGVCRDNATVLSVVAMAFVRLESLETGSAGPTQATALLGQTRDSGLAGRVNGTWPDLRVTPECNISRICERRPLGWKSGLKSLEANALTPRDEHLLPEGWPTSER